MVSSSTLKNVRGHNVEFDLMTGAASWERTGRSLDDIDLIVPVFAVPGDSTEDRAALSKQAKTRIAFYGTTPNYHFQFDDLGYAGMTAKLRERMKTGDIEGMANLISDEMLDQFGLVARWDDLADRLLARYGKTAARVVMYLGEDDMRNDPQKLGKWSKVARAVRAGTGA